MRTWSPRIKRAVTNWLALPQDALLDVSRLTCIGGSEVILENVVSLDKVSSTEIRLQLEKVVLELHGEQFEVTLVAGREIHVRGVLSRVLYIRPGGEQE